MSAKDDYKLAYRVAREMIREREMPDWNEIKDINPAVLGNALKSAAMVAVEDYYGWFAVTMRRINHVKDRWKRPSLIFGMASVTLQQAADAFSKFGRRMQA
jgi:hypothetical protein